MRRDPARYYLLRNVLVRQGDIVLFVPPAADGAEPAGIPEQHYFQRPGIGPYVNISYEQAPLTGGDPFAACVHAVFGPDNSSGRLPGWLVP